MVVPAPPVRAAFSSETKPSIDWNIMRSRITLFVSVDTEEDSWVPARSDITIDNIRRLPRLEAFFEKLGVRATYLTTYQVVSRTWASEILRGIHKAGRSEVGGHLHPWNTPPTVESFDPRNTMTGNLPYELQLAKIRCLTRALEAAIGSPPISFRAGRYGLGPDTVRALIRCGYQVDSSVTPLVSWERVDGGPDFSRAPLECHALKDERDVQEWGVSGRLVEVPLSLGFSRGPFRLWSRLYSVLNSPVLRALPAVGIAGRLGLPKMIVMSPEMSSAAEMLSLSSQLINQGLRHLQVCLHSPSLLPGLTPYVVTSADVDRLCGAIETYLEGLDKIAQVEFATLREALLLNSDRAP